jgi:bromodomain and WD repeat domain-containing protein 1/3
VIINCAVLKDRNFTIRVIFLRTEIPETQTKDEGIPASEEDLHSDLYEASARDWPPFGHQESECQRIAGLFEDVMGLGAAENFLTPVDLNKYPEYIYEIAYPVDLNTIKTRLQNHFYRRLDALKFDIKHIAINAEQFNRPMTDIVKKARIIRDLCLQISR